MIRRATLEDVPTLMALEDQSFQTDRLTRRQFRYLLTKGQADTFVAGREGHPALVTLRKVARQQTRLLE